MYTYTFDNTPRSPWRPRGSPRCPAPIVTITNISIITTIITIITIIIIISSSSVTSITMCYVLSTLSLSLVLRYNYCGHYC